MSEVGKTVACIYRNYRGEIGLRRITPLSIEFGSNEWHPEPQWLLNVFDCDKQAPRVFGMSGILYWGSMAEAEAWLVEYEWRNADKLLSED